MVAFSLLKIPVVLLLAHNANGAGNDAEFTETDTLGVVTSVAQATQEVLYLHPKGESRVDKCSKTSLVPPENANPTESQTGKPSDGEAPQTDAEQFLEKLAQKRDRIVKRLAFAGLVATTGGTMLAFERLSEALKNNEVDPINEMHVLVFTILLVLGPALIAYAISKKLEFKMDSAIYTCLAAGVAGGLFSAGFYFLSAKNEKGSIIESFNASSEAQFFWAMSGLVIFSIVVIFACGFLSNEKNRGPQIVGALGHFVGFTTLVGGSGMASYIFFEELRDVELDSMGMECMMIWAAWSIGLFWFMKAFMAKGGQHEHVKDLIWNSQNRKLMLIASAVAGCITGGLECLLNTRVENLDILESDGLCFEFSIENASTIGMAACFGGALFGICFVMFLKFGKGNFLCINADGLRRIFQK